MFPSLLTLYLHSFGPSGLSECCCVSILVSIMLHVCAYKGLHFGLANCILLQCLHSLVVVWRAQGFLDNLQDMLMLLKPVLLQDHFSL